jgi:hypothetical protein
MCEEIGAGIGAVVTDPVRRRRRWPWVVGAVVLLAIAVLAVALVQDIRASLRSLPSFASLAESPDPTLEGTIAYYDGTTGCVRIAVAQRHSTRFEHGDVVLVQSLSHDAEPMSDV